MNRFDNIDCMIGMKEYPDRYFDLAIVDPPYGIKNWGLENCFEHDTNKSRTNELSGQARAWDKRPTKEYFTELDRVSKRYIIWGYNYFTDLLGNTNNLIAWDKKITGIKYLSRFELAYCSFNTSSLVEIPISYEQPKQHPTQKPIKLYKWLLDKYANPYYKILDTHVGSASSLIACEDLGFEYVGFELDKDYYDSANKRLEQFRSQLKLKLNL